MIAVTENVMTLVGVGAISSRMTSGSSRKKRACFDVRSRVVLLTVSPNVSGNLYRTLPNSTVTTNPHPLTLGQRTDDKTAVELIINSCVETVDADADGGKSVRRQ